MATIPTQLPVASETPRDLKFNAGKIDEFVTSLKLVYEDRFGAKHYTVEGLRWVAQQAIAAFGYITMDSFQDGATLTLPNQVLRDKSTGEYYRWDGDFGGAGKVVPPGSTPNSTGGIGIGAWIAVGDASLRGNLASDVLGAASVDHIHVKSDTSVSFRKFLSVKNGSVNATQALIDAMTSGYAVEIPHDYVLRVESANLPTQSGTRIFGQAGSRPSILIDHTDTTSPQIAVTVFNYFANLRFRYPHQKLALATGEEPIAYGALFDGGGYFSELHNIDVGNAYYAFKLGNETSSSSKITMSNIIGAPLFRGLSLDRAMDVPRVSDIHWNYNFMRDYLLPGENYTYDDTLKLWMQNNATAFHIGRCDFATFFRLFSYGYFRGLYTRSERYTGSADNCRFVGCDQDMCLHPMWFQNWQNRISVIDTKLVGAINSGYALKEPSSNVIYDNSQSSSVAIIDGVDMGYLSSNALATGTNTVITNSKIHDYGVVSGSQGNGVIQTSDRTVYIDGTVINGSSGSQTRGVFSSTSSKQLTLGDGMEVVGATLSSYDWRYGSVAPSRNARLGGSPGHNGISFVSNIPKTYPCELMPTAGNYFKKGDYAEMTKPAIHSATGVPAYIVKGWNRLTDSNSAGTNHAIGIDWVEDRNYFNGLIA
ncbi:hypothetical protein SMQE08_14570 [Serratia marcescens]|nr:hypothetical protein SMQE08_14570 [Serratia marcescens]